MPTGLTQAMVVNQALQEVAAQVGVTGAAPNFSGPNSAASVAAGILYTPAIEFLLRQQDYEFARTKAALKLSGNAPPFGFAFEYIYPSDCLRILSVLPPNWNLNDPQAVRWSVAEATVGAELAKVVHTNVASAQLFYTTSNVTEAQWDSMFQEAAVRYLASEIVMAIGGRPDFSKQKLTEAGGITAASAGRDS